MSGSAARSTGLRPVATKFEASSPCNSFVGVDFVVDATATYTGLACPRINVRARLAGLHVSHSTLVPKIADLRVIASLGSVRIMASKGFERVQKRQGRWISDPLYSLPIRNYPYIVHRDDGVEK